MNLSNLEELILSDNKLEEKGTINFGKNAILTNLTKLDLG